jgi:cation:H+ antiporter
VGWWIVWPQFFLILGVIAVSGTQLSKYGDVLAEKTGLGRTWLGLAGLAVVTSLPELITGTSAVLWVGEPDLAIGDLLGACVINLIILANTDLIFPTGPVLTAAARGHIMAASFALILLAIVSLGLIAGAIPGLPSLGYIGFSTPLLLFCYVLAMQATYRYHKRERQVYFEEEEKAQLYPHESLREASLKFAFHALVIVAAATWLPHIADRLAQVMGWHLSLVGTVFVAAVTTAPELVVTIGALRLGALDLAFGDLLGSLLVNVAMIGIMDLLYFKGPILGSVAPQHSATALLALLMTSIAVAKMVYRPQKLITRYLSLSAFLLSFLYAVFICSQLLTWNR